MISQLNTQIVYVLSICTFARSASPQGLSIYSIQWKVWTSPSPWLLIFQDLKLASFRTALHGANFKTRYLISVTFQVHVLPALPDPTMNAIIIEQSIFKDWIKSNRIIQILFFKSHVHVTRYLLALQNLILCTAYERLVWNWMPSRPFYVFIRQKSTSTGMKQLLEVNFSRQHHRSRRDTDFISRSTRF